RARRRGRVGGCAPQRRRRGKAAVWRSLRRRSPAPWPSASAGGRKATKPRRTWPGLRLDVPADRGLVAVAAAVAAPAGASAGAVFTRLGLVDGQRAALVVGPLERRDRLVAALAHLYAAEAPPAARVPV